MLVNYFDDLLDTIRYREQHYNEFVTQFKDNCSRLQTPLLTHQKIEILKRNVLTKYQPQIVLMPFTDINQFKQSLKRLETAMSSQRVSFASERYSSREGRRSSERHPSSGRNNGYKTYGRDRSQSPYESSDSVHNSRFEGKNTQKFEARTKSRYSSKSPNWREGNDSENRVDNNKSRNNSRSRDSSNESRSSLNEARGLSKNR